MSFMSFYEFVCGCVCSLFAPLQIIYVVCMDFEVDNIYHHCRNKDLFHFLSVDFSSQMATIFNCFCR